MTEKRSVSDSLRADAGDDASLLARLEQLWELAAKGGDAFPGEPALASALAASRAALREALVRLEERGYINRRQGMGTAINRAVLDIPVRIDEKVENARIIDAMGKVSRIELIAMEWGEATAEEIARFDAAQCFGVLRTTKVWYADESPVIKARDVIPVRSEGISRGDVDARASVFELSEQLGNRPAEWETVWLSAVHLGDDAVLMGGTAQESILELDVTGVAREGAAAYWATERHRTVGFRYAMVRSLSER